MLVLALWRLLLIPRQVRAIGYAEREDDLLIRRGIFFQRTLVVPYGRMQYVDIGAGPVERGLGLCTLKLHTASAGTNAEIPGLPAAKGRGSASSSPPAAKPGWPGCDGNAVTGSRWHRRMPEAPAPAEPADRRPAPAERTRRRLAARAPGLALCPRLGGAGRHRILFRPGHFRTDAPGRPV